MVCDTCEWRFRSVVVESITLARISRRHLALGPIFGKFLAIITACTSGTHIRRRMSGHQAAVRAVACMRCARGICLCCEGPA